MESAEVILDRLMKEMDTKDKKLLKKSVPTKKKKKKSKVVKKTVNPVAPPDIFAPWRVGLNTFFKKVKEFQEEHRPNDSDYRVYSISLYPNGVINDHTMYGYNCHGNLSEQPKGCEYVVTAFNKASFDANWKGRDKSIVYTWLYWVLNESPFASTFVTKDVDEAMRNGVISTADAPANMLIGGLHLFRNVWEWNQHRKIEIWGELINLGVNKNKAYTLCSLFTHSTIGEGTWKIKGLSDDDAVNAKYWSLEDFSNFVKGTPWFELPPYKKHVDFYAVFKAFNKMNDDRPSGGGPIFKALTYYTPSIKKKVSYGCSRAFSTEELVNLLYSFSFLF